MLVIVPHHLFTYSRKARSHMVCEDSTLRANVVGWPSRAWPQQFAVQGATRQVVYTRSPMRDVYDAGHEDLVATVYVPARPQDSGLPEVHVLNT